MEVVLNNTDIQECTIIGTGIKTSLLNATLINSTAGHGFESDDIHRESILHPNSIIIPVSINVSEKIKNVSGKHFLTAVVAGYEIATRVGSAAGTELLLRGFHPQGTHGTIASTVTAAKLMNLNKSQTLHAIGIAGSLGAGLMAAQEGAMVKRLHSGRAAEAGVLAAELAAKKFTGISNIIEADYGGYLSSFSGKNNFARSTDQLGEVWECINTGIPSSPHFAQTGSIRGSLMAIRFPALSLFDMPWLLYIFRPLAPFSTSTSICLTVSTDQSGSSILCRLMFVKTTNRSSFPRALMLSVICLSAAPPRPLKFTRTCILRESISPINFDKSPSPSRHWWL